ncbi:hypothetical protein HF086_017481 [Spodoptera exigua]|uniref:Uncharacterized protein n=1 Tax=Spodoptera exigua TaxID=7107 RepID=A0A922M3Z5_SPOEX|nr:hypothetical protein HF086_017481 [Spodoptera exigua]
MAVAILYLFIIGLISCTGGKPADSNLNGIENLVKQLAQQKGKFDIAISHHEDSPKSHHEDKARITQHVGKSRTNAASDESNENKLTATNVQSIYNLHTKPDKVQQRPEGSTLIQRLLGCTDASKCKNLLQLQSRILDYLNDDNTRDDEDKNELRCAGDRCGRDGEDLGDSSITVRCVGNRCSIDNDDGENLRCAGNRCNRDEENVGDSSLTVRCVGNRCSIDNDDGENLRCAGDRCSKDGEGDSSLTVRCVGNRCSIDNDDGENLRCAGNACGTSRDDAPCNSNQCGRNTEELLRCNGNRCSIRDDNDQEADNLRCYGNRCSQNRDRDDYTARCGGKLCSIARYNENDNRNDETQWQPKRVKLNDNVDAYILGIDDIQYLLNKYSSRNNQLSGDRTLGSKDLEDLLNNKYYNIGTALNDVEKRNDNYDLAKQIKRLLTGSSY